MARDATRRSGNRTPRPPKRFAPIDAPCGGFIQPREAVTINGVTYNGRRPRSIDVPTLYRGIADGPANFGKTDG